MGRKTVWGMALVIAVLGGCGGETEPAASSASAGTPSPPIPTASVTATVSPTVSPSASPSAAAEACERFGTKKEVSSSDPLALSEMTGASMRVGRHDCYERFVFEMAGEGAEPGWYVGYRDPMTYQGSGDEVVILGDADLAVTVGVWTVNDYAGRPDEWPPFTGPDDLVTSDFLALREARNLYAFEGTTQIALGVDRRRPFRVFRLDGPPRLVVDIYTGELLD